MRPEDVFDFLQRAKATFMSLDAGDRVAVYTAFENFYDRKLWHQLTVQLLQYVQRPDVIQNGNELQQLYDNFVADFEDKINQLSLVQISLAIARSITDAPAALAFLQKIGNKVKTSSQEAYALTVSETAQLHLSMGNLNECKTAIAEAEALLDKIAGVDPVIHASFYRVSANYDKTMANYTSYYKNALLYLACVPVEAIPAPEQLQRAHDLGVAALLADSIYNFGELLAHPILQSLVGTPLQWLKELLHAFNAGDLDTFERLLPTVQSQPGLAENVSMLRNKLSLMTLIEMLFRRAAGERRVSFDQIAHQVRVPRNRVELLLMRAMSLKLIRGTIDEVDGVVVVSWVTPRVLDVQQIKSLAARLASWSETVSGTILKIQTQSPDLFVQ